MRSSIVIVGAIVASAIVIIGSYYFVSHKNKVSEPQTVDSMVIAPEFSFPDAEGNNVSLLDSEGKIKVINFWASWSPYSKEELPALNRIQKEFGDDVVVIALSRDHSLSEGQAFLQKHDIERVVTFVYDKDDEYYKKMSGF